MKVHPVLADVTAALAERSRGPRGDYLARITTAASPTPRAALSCSNFAHGFAACPVDDKQSIRGNAGPNLAIVTAYNDMLSAHAPYERYPAFMRAAAREFGATAQVAGGVPAMCDGITQGRPGMELSLFSRDVIALSTAIALSHEMFDAALFLGICDKIVPGLLIGALSFGHLPAVFVPSGPMPSGLPNKAKSEVRQRYAGGTASREELLAAEAASYHGRGTCTFYGTANSNQLLMEVMGLHLPGASFVPPDSALRDALTREAVRRASALTARGADYLPVGRLFDERTLLNGVVGLLASGGSTNHLLHLIAIGRAAGLVLELGDFERLSGVVPTLVRMYPNGSADVNEFQAAGGTACLIGELLDAGLLHADVSTIHPGGLAAYRLQPYLEGGQLRYAKLGASADPAVLRPVAEAFSATGALKVLHGNLGTAAIKTSAVPADRMVVEATAIVVDDPAELVRLHRAGALARDFVAVVRFQGPRANGMPEMHSLTPILGLLQDAGHRVALVTDGRMSGASGKVPAAIHVTPEAADGGPLARVATGDRIVLDASQGLLELRVDAVTLAGRAPASIPPPGAGIGRELFATLRRLAGPADRGASILGDLR
jgi:phosphogluconate dehydratase